MDKEKCMENIDDAEEEIIEPVANKECRHCSQTIKLSANVCHHCSRVQGGFFRFANFIRVAEVISFFISAGLLTVALLNWSLAKEQLGQAREANTN